MSRLTLAGKATSSLQVQGRFLYVDDADARVKVTAELVSGRVDTVELRKGDQVEYVDDALVSIEVTNLSASTNNVRLLTGWAKYHPRPDGGAVTIDGSVAVTGALNDAELRAAPVEVAQVVPGTLNAPAPVVPTTAGTTIAANANRTKIVLYAPSTNTFAVDIAATAGQGIPLEPGKSITLETTAAIPLVAGDADDAVTYIELE